MARVPSSSRRRPKRTLILAVVVAALAAGSLTACSSGGGPGVVLVDKTHDAFAASMVDFFPDTVYAHPGQTVRFRQLWTGEPHSVTFGNLFNDELGRIRARLARKPIPEAKEMPELKLLDALPVMLGRGDDEFAVNQNGAQPCYLDEGAPPTDPDVACPQRPQPLFNGRQTYYSSGFIPYAGAGGNRFDVRLAGDIKPGSYNFYCNLHGVGQSGTIKVVAAGDAVPSASKIAKRTQNEIAEQYSDPLATAWKAAKDGSLTIDGVAHRTPLAGAATNDVRPWGGLAHRNHFGHRHGSVNEFAPTTVQAKVGEPVTWTFIGRHTVSFNVPKYLPVFALDGEQHVRMDPRVSRPVGWTIPEERTVGEPLIVDAGPWNGVGFRSTGLDWRIGDQFRMSFSHAGTYLLACLIHPTMVGKVIVK